MSSSAFRTGLLVLFLVVTVMLCGCGSDGPSSGSEDKAVAEQLQKSFDMAEETIKQRTAQAAEALVAKDYARAVSTMNQVVRNQRTLNGAQKEALDNLLAHARRAVEKDPSLNSRQLYTDTMALQLLLHPME